MSGAGSLHSEWRSLGSPHLPLPNAAAMTPLQTFQAGGGERGAPMSQGAYPSLRGCDGERRRSAGLLADRTRNKKMRHRRCTHVAAPTSPIDTSTRIAERALTSGVTAVFNMP